MKIQLPKASRGFVFNKLSVFEMNSFNIEELLPSLFYLVVTGGRQRAGLRNDPSKIAAYIGSLAEHENVDGFRDSRGRELLEKWVRSSLIVLSRVGKQRAGEQIEYIVPLTILAYKAGLPRQIRRLRGVHTFLYEAMHQALARSHAKPSPEAALKSIFCEA